MSGGKLVCILGLAASLLAGYAQVAGVVGPWMNQARTLGAVHRDGRTVEQLAHDLGVDGLPVGGAVLSRGRGVFGSYVSRVRLEGG